MRCLCLFYRVSLRVRRLGNCRSRWLSEKWEIKGGGFDCLKSPQRIRRNRWKEGISSLYRVGYVTRCLPIRFLSRYLKQARLGRRSHRNNLRRAVSLFSKNQTTMKMFAALFATVLIVGCAHGSPMANQYVDSVLHTALRNEIRMLQLDPASVPDFSTKFEDKVAIIGKVKGKAEYTNGNLTGLSQVRRYSECQGPYYGYGAKSVNCTIVFDLIGINYEGKLKYGKMPKVNIKAEANITTSLVFIEVSQAVPMQPFVKNFLYQQTGYQQIRHTGLGPLNKYMKILDDGFRGHVQAEVFNSMSQRFQYALNRAVAVVPLPN